MVHAGLRKHGVVLDLRLPDGRGVVADDDQLGCTQTSTVRTTSLLQLPSGTAPPFARSAAAMRGDRGCAGIADKPALCVSMQYIPLPFRRVLIAVFVPSVNLPDFITSASREFMFSADRFCAHAKQPCSVRFHRSKDEGREGRAHGGGGARGGGCECNARPSSAPCCRGTGKA